MEETQRETHTNDAEDIVLNDKISEKVLEFVSNYTIEYIGQKFVDKWITSDLLLQSSIDHTNNIMPKLLQSLPELKLKYNEIQNNNTCINKTTVWTDYLFKLDFVNILIYIPIINDVNKASVGDKCWDECCEKHCDLNHIKRTVELMTNIVLMNNDTLYKHRYTKIVNFTNQFVVDYLGQEFIDERLNFDKIVNENELHVKNTIMKKLSKIFREYKNMRRRTDEYDNEEEFQDNWHEYLYNISEYESCFTDEIPIIKSINDLTSDLSGNGFMAYIERKEELGYDKKFMELIDKLRVMT